jgi:hypothetical protein
MKIKLLLLLLSLQALSYASIGKITVTNGDISVLRASKSLKASSGFALEEKDSIKSTKGSTAQLVFNDNTVITVGSNTTFSVQEYSSDASSPKAKFAIAEGTFKTITGKIGKIAPDKFKMETKTATIGIRGTTVVGNVAPDGTLTVACTRGAITVTPNVPQGQPTVVPQGQFTKSKGGNVEPPRQLTPNDLRNLQGDLAPLARNNTPATEAQGSTNETPPVSQNAEQNSVPNVNPVQQLTEQATSSVVNDKTAAAVKGGGIPPNGITQYQLENYMNAAAGTTANVTLVGMNGATSVSMTMKEFVTPPYSINGVTNSGSNTKMWISNDGKYVYTSDKDKLDYLTGNDLYAVSSTQFTVGSYSQEYPNSTPIANQVSSVYVKSGYTNTAAYTGVTEIRRVTDGGAGAIDGITVPGFYPVATTFADLVTNVKLVLTESSIPFSGGVLKFEPLGNEYRKWTYSSSDKVFTEMQYSQSDWHYTGKYAALYSDIESMDLSATAYSGLYIYGTPAASQSLPSGGYMSDGGKWYFKFDATDVRYSDTVKIGANVPYTDAVKASSNADIPFMAKKSDANVYPVFFKTDGSVKYVYSSKYYGDLYGANNSYDALINSDYYIGNNEVMLVDQSLQQAAYLFAKTDATTGALIGDERNGKLVNPLTGNMLNVYVNLYDVNDNYVSGPINNQALNTDNFIPGTAGNWIDYAPGGGVFGSGTINMTNVPATGADFWKLAIEKASWSGKPADGSVYMFGRYNSTPNSSNITKVNNSDTFIKFPTTGNGIFMQSHLDVIEERVLDAEGSLVQSYYEGSITTGRIVQDGTSNKLVAKHFSFGKGIETTGAVASDGYVYGGYLFNENGQFVDSDIGGLDNNRLDTDTKYNWMAMETKTSAGSVANVELMKKVADNTDTALFSQVSGFNPDYGTGYTKGFIVGGSALNGTPLNDWIGDITGLNTNSMSGELMIGAASDTLGLINPKAMFGLGSVYDPTATIASASYLGEDLQSIIVANKTVNGKQFDFAMATMPDNIVVSNDALYGYKDDYSAWGYWMARETDASSNCSMLDSSCNKVLAQGYWVAGHETLAATLDTYRQASATYDYTGNVLGNIIDANGVINPIKMDNQNYFAMSVNFGTANPVQISAMQFNAGVYVIDGSAISTISSTVGGVNPSTTAITSNALAASASWGSGANNVNLQGKFYGPNAESAGGAWAGTFNSGVLKGSGVFKAGKPIGTP